MKRAVKLYPWDNKEVVDLFIEASSQPEVVSYPMKDPLVAMSWLIKKQKDMLKNGKPWDVADDFTSHPKYLAVIKSCKTKTLKEAIQEHWLA